MVCGRNGVLVFPALFRVVGTREGFGKPVGGAGEGGFAVEVEDALSVACAEFGLVEGRGATVAEGVEEGAGVVDGVGIESVDLQKM